VRTGQGRAGGCDRRGAGRVEGAVAARESRGKVDRRGAKTGRGPIARRRSTAARRGRTGGATLMAAMRSWRLNGFAAADAAASVASVAIARAPTSRRAEATIARRHGAPLVWAGPRRRTWRAEKAEEAARRPRRAAPLRATRRVVIIADIARKVLAKAAACARGLGARSGRADGSEARGGERPHARPVHPVPRHSSAPASGHVTGSVAFLRARETVAHVTPPHAHARCPPSPSPPPSPRAPSPRPRAPRARPSPPRSRPSAGSGRTCPRTSTAKRWRRRRR